MSKPIFVLAGQSNAAALSDAIQNQLTKTFGTDGFILIRSFSAGAPLTRVRDGKSDWQETGDLRDHLVENTIQTLQTHPDSHLAAVLWLQGEADTYAKEDASRYSDNFKTLAHEFTSAVARTKGQVDGNTDISVPFVISGLSQNAPAAKGRAAWDEVRDQHFALSNETTIELVDPDALAETYQLDNDAVFIDDLHYSSDFAHILARQLVATAVNQTEQALPTHSNTAGNDTLIGHATNLLLRGGTGDDNYYIETAAAKIIEFKNQGQDSVFANISFSLRDHSQNLETLTLGGVANLFATGNRLDNVLVGNSGDNRINGALGDDHLFGGAGHDTFRDAGGADVMTGGTGNDTFYVDHRDDVLVERAGEGYDHVFSDISLALRTFGHAIESLKLTGQENLNATGNATDNHLRGNRGDNTLYGAWGDDFLAGGAGNDTLGGGVGNDRLVGGLGADVFEFSRKFGRDIVDDFEVGLAGELIDLRHQSTINTFSELVQNHLYQVGRASVIDFHDGNTITLRSTDAELLTADHFIF